MLRLRYFSDFVAQFVNHVLPTGSLVRGHFVKFYALLDIQLSDRLTVDDGSNLSVGGRAQRKDRGRSGGRHQTCKRDTS